MVLVCALVVVGRRNPRTAFCQTAVLAPAVVAAEIAFGGGAHLIAEGTCHGPREQGPISRICCNNKAGSYLRLIESCIIQRRAQRPYRICNNSEKEEEVEQVRRQAGACAACQRGISYKKSFSF